MSSIARKSVPLALSLTLAAACSSASTPLQVSPGPGSFHLTWTEGGPAAASPRLVASASCDEAEARIEDALVTHAHRQLALYLRWAEQWGDVVAQGMPEAPAGEAKDAGAGGPEAYTKGNDQVEGVEEADFVKNGARHVFQLVGDRLHVVRTWPADSMARLASIALDGQGLSLFFDEEKARLVVLSQPAIGVGNEGGAAADAALRSTGQQAYDWSAVQVTVYDVAAPETPRPLESYHVDGWLLGARRVGGDVRLVLAAGQRYPEGFVGAPADFSFWRWSKERREAWVATTSAANEALIRGQSLAYWLAHDRMARRSAAGVEAPLFDAPDCAAIHVPAAPAAPGMTRVVSLDLESGAAAETVLATRVDRIYASQDALYAATSYYWWDEEQKDRDHTFLHKLETPAGQAARYVGSGGVEGTLLNQFSLDEHAGHLRVATTITTRERAPTANDWGTWQTTNRVTTFAARDGALVETGRTPDLAPGERIFSARFMGERGYVVTFRQVDPLYTLDLADPAAPRVVGELKIPGFSSYIHPIADGLLLTVGRDADEATGAVHGLKLSLFDVTDPTAPREAHGLLLDAELWTEAQWDHRAFTWHPARRTLAMPTSRWYREPKVVDGRIAWGESGVALFRVDPVDGIRAAGHVDLSDMAWSEGEACAWCWGATAQRAMFADDYVYALSDLGVRSAHLADPARPVATVRY